MSVSRVVALLTPLFAVLAGWVATQATKLPGAPVLDTGELTAVFIAGATVAGAAAWKWLDGRGKWDLREHDREMELERDARSQALYSREPDHDLMDPEELAELVASRLLERVQHPESVDLTGMSLEEIRGVVGVTGAESDASRALQAVRGLDRRLEDLEKISERAGSSPPVVHHPV